jgi:rod shape-determining protein MreD
MKDLIKVSLSVLFAFFFYTIFAKIFPFFIYLVNIFSLVVIYFAVKKGEVFGACLGTFCGLVQDSFSLGVFGVAGLAKTVTGFLAGYLAKRFYFLSPLRSFVLIGILASFEFVFWALLYSFILSERINTGNGLIFFQPLGTALSGSLLFFIIGKIKKNKL